MDWLFPWLSKKKDETDQNGSPKYSPFWLTRIKVKPLTRIGQGSYGVVYMAEVVQVREGFDELDVGDRVALKIIDYQQDAQEELEVYEKIKENENSIRICSIASCLFDFRRRSDGRTYIAYQLLDYAADIANVVRRLESISRNEATRLLRMKIVKEISVTVGILHTVDIFHRDLKPANLVMGENLHHRSDDMLETWRRFATLTNDPEFDDSETPDSNFTRYLKLKRFSVDIDSVAETTFVELFVVEPLIVKVIDLGLSVFGCHKYSEDEYFGSQLLKDPWYHYILKNVKEIEKYNKEQTKNLRDGNLFTRWRNYKPIFIESFENQYPTDSNLQQCDVRNSIWKSMDVWSLGLTLYNVFHGHFPFMDLTMRGEKWYVENTSLVFLRIRPKIGIVGYFSKVPINNLELFEENFEDIMADFAVVINYKDLGDGFLEFEEGARTVRRGHILVPDRRLIVGAKYVDSKFDKELYLKDYRMIKPIRDLLQVYPLDRTRDVLQFATDLKIDIDKLE